LSTGHSPEAVNIRGFEMASSEREYPYSSGGWFPVAEKKSQQSSSIEREIQDVERKAGFYKGQFNEKKRKFLNALIEKHLLLSPGAPQNPH